MRHSERQAFWQEHITQHNRLDISSAAYAKRYGLDLKRYYYWRKKLVKEKPSKLVPIMMANAPRPRLTFAIEDNGDLIISGANRDQVAQVVSALMR